LQTLFKSRVCISLVGEDLRPGYSSPSPICISISHVDVGHVSSSIMSCDIRMTQPTYNCRTVAIVCSSVMDQSTKEAVFWWIYWSGDCRSCWSVSYAYGL